MIDTTIHIEKILDELIINNPEKAKDAEGNIIKYRWFVGQIMKITNGTLNPFTVSKIVKKRFNIDINSISY